MNEIKGYIEKDRAIELAIKACNEDMFADDAMLGIIEYIDKEPAADVAPVIHAKWIAYNKDKDDPRMICGNCLSVEMPLDRHKHCPHCGAIMDME